jgi:hypothetical protein
MNQASTLVATILSLTMLCGCGDDKENKKACPSKGIAVAATDGTPCSTASADPTSTAGKDCREQVEKYKDFDCFEPQVCLDQSKRKIPDLVLDPKAQGQEVSFILTNCSTGHRKLTISRLVLAGDSRCVFTEPEIDPGKVIEPGGQITLRTVYKPTAVGEDHAALIVESDGQNYPKFVIPICGKVIPKFAPGADSGPPPTSDAGAGPVFDCKDVQGKITTSCHKE